VAVRLIFDASALVAYAELTSIAPSELILQVEEGGETVGVCAPALIEAYQQCKTDGRARLLNLVHRDDTPVAILPLTGGHTIRVASIMTTGHSMGRVHSAIESAVVHRCNLVTADRAELERLVDPDTILDV
jgi:hypothetical protein